MPFQFDNTYLNLNASLYSKVNPTVVDDPKLVVLNAALADTLALDIKDIPEQTLADYFSGNKIIKGSEPIAQAYAGHQFGGFANLGDGRAVLLGEHIAPNSDRFDIQLKGAGPTPYSRRGDGRASLSAMLREYLMSEAIFYLGIPTTRSLAVVSTGEHIYREAQLPGAVLTRIASSHIRVGTFEYVRTLQSEEALIELTSYTLQRHYSDLVSAENQALALLQKVIDVQVNLIVNWMRVGFIHGVMNTDNMSIAGETIDYGPCAFMNAYDPATVFSSIDHQKRYAFGKQPDIALWNITRLAEALLPIIDSNREAAVEKAKSTLQFYPRLFDDGWLQMMRSKIGIIDVQAGDEALISRLMDWMHVNKADYTNTFIQLSVPTFSESPIYKQDDFINWQSDWKKRIGADKGIPAKSLEMMQKSNPAYIPRNHQVEDALQQAQNNGDLKAFNNLIEIQRKAYNYEDMNDYFQQVPVAFDESYQTFCGT